MHRPASVVPRAVFDAPAADARRWPPGRSCAGTSSAGSTSGPTHVEVDGVLTAGVVVGADGAESVVRRAVGHRAEPAATSWRSRSAATRPSRPATAGVQVIAHDRAALAGLRLVVPARRRAGQRRLRRAGLRRASPAAGCWPGCDRLLPGVEPAGLRAHRLPLSTGRPRQPDGRVLLAGDAASLINPLTGEGIFYAVLSGALAGRGRGARRRRGRGLPAGAARAGSAGTCGTRRRRPGPAAGRG